MAMSRQTPFHEAVSPGGRTGERSARCGGLRYLCGGISMASGFYLWLSVRLRHGQHSPAVLWCAVQAASGECAVPI